MRRRIIFLIFLLGIIAILTLASCNGGMYSVTFDSNGGTEVNAQNAIFGRVVEPDEPVRDGYTFKGWYYGEDKWDFVKNTVSESITLKAEWELDTYYITYDGMVRGSFHNNRKSYTVETENRVLNDPVIPFGYTFGGWFDENGNKVTELTKGDIVLRADFIPFPELEAFKFYSDDASVCITGVSDTSVKSITIPDYVTKINSNAFNNCNKLESVYISDLSKWCDIEFENSLSNPLNFAGELYVDGILVTDLVIPEGVTEIKAYAFKGCEWIRTVDFPSTLNTIGARAFSDCVGIRTLKISDNTTKIGDYAFSQCEGLISVSFGASVISIGEKAFANTTRLAEVIDRTSLEIKPNDFGMEAIEVHNGDTRVVNKDGFWFYSSDNGNYLLGSDIKYQRLVLPESLEGEKYSVYKHAFAYDKNILTLTVPDSVRGIGEYAFYCCNSLLSVELGKNVWKIDNNAFIGCRRLVEVINRSGITLMAGSSEYGSVGAYALDVKSKESKISEVSDYLFYTFGETSYLMNYIGSEDSIELPRDHNGKEYKIYNYAFRNTLVRHIVISDGVNEILEQAFAYSSKLTTVVIGDTVKAIGDFGFCECRMLKSVDIGNGVREIGENAFWNCRALVEFRIGSGLESFGKDAFSECYALSAFYVSEDNQRFKSIEGVLISDDGSELIVFPSGMQTSVYSIPDTVRVIRPYAFSWNMNLREVIIHDEVTEICERAFEYCENLRSAVIGRGVVKIGYSAFYATDLNRLVIKDPDGWAVGMVTNKVPRAWLEDPVTAARYLKSDYSYQTWLKS